MGIKNFIGKTLKKMSAIHNPSINNNLNQLNNDKLMSSHTFVQNPNYLIPVDDNNNNVPDMLELKHRKEYGDGNPSQEKLNPFSFKKPRKDYNQSFDKKGFYVPTATYPLPPLSHDKKMFDRNKRMRNKNNKFL